MGSTSLVDASVGEPDGEFARSWVEVELPSTLVDEVMMPSTARDQSVEVRLAMMRLPFVDVMHLAVLEWNVALADAATAVHRAECSSLIVGCQTPAAPHVERNTVAAQHDGNDVGVTREPSDGGDRNRCAVAEFGGGVGVQAGGERLDVDHGKQFDLARPPRAAR